MIKKIIGIIVIIVIVVSAIMLVTKRQQEIADAPTAKAISATINVYKPTLKEISQKEPFLAIYSAVNQPNINSKVSAFIKKIHVKESQSVKKGDLLVEIDDGDIVSSIESLKANRDLAKQDLALSYKSLKRAKALYDIGGISKESYEMAQLAHSSKKAKLTTIKKSIKAKENLLTYTKILSPINATIGTIFIKEGSLSSANKPIMTIVGEQKQLLFSFAPSTPIKVGQKVEVNGFIEEVSSIYQTSKNSLISAKILLKNDLELPSGSSVDIRVVLKSEKGMAVPLNALLHDGDVSLMVYKDGQFSKEKVQINVANDEFAIISPPVTNPVAIGSESKLSRLPILQNVKVVFDEK